MNRLLFSRPFVAVGVLALAAAAGGAQTITGAITGTVTDASGAVVSGAKVTATNTATGVVTPTVTNASGSYTLNFLQIGSYKVTVEATGFTQQSTSGFTLEVSQQARIDVTLNVGGESQVVTVTDAAPILNAENPTTGDTITAAQATELPLQARNFSSLTTLVAGAISPNPGAQNNIGRSGYNGGFFVNGNREQTNNYTLDGADINEAIDNYIGYSPNVDAIGELRIITGNATAEYGNANGGQVVAVTKSGTNALHGNAFWFLENTNLDANSWVNKHVASGQVIAPVPNLNRSQFGGTVGGPIFKDKLFFFGDYQGGRQHTSNIDRRSVATAAMRAGFSPATGKTYTITNPAARYLFANPALYPLPNVGGADTTNIVQNYQGSNAQFVRNDQGDVKIDGKLTAKDTISGRFSMGRESDGYGKVSLPTDVPSNNNDPYTGFVVNYTHVFSANVVNEARAGFGRTRYTSVAQDVAGQLGLTGNAKLGIPGTQVAPGISTLDASSSNVEAIGGGTGSGGASANGVESDSIVNAFIYGDNLSWQRGRHNIRLGGQAIRYQANRNYSGNDGARGFFSYNTGNDPWGQFLTDKASEYGQGSYNDAWAQRQWRDALFVQDDWKATPNLTINLGMRWEWDQPLYEAHNKQTNINLTTGAIEFPGQNGNSRALYNDFWYGYMPRLGFAYSPPTLNGKFVIRGGYGITNFYEGTGANLRLPLNPPFFIDSSGQGDGITTSFQVENGFPRPADTSTFSGNVRAWDPKLKPALIQQFNLTTETQLNATTSLVIAYLGQTGDHLVDPREGNQLRTPGTSASQGPVAQLPGLALVTQVSLTESEAVMNYNAVQVTGRHRAAQGLEFLTNYTYSKALTNNLGYYGAGGGAAASQSAYWQDSYNGAADYGPAFFNSKHIFTFSGYYDLPFGRGKRFGGNMNRVVDLAAGGWKVGAIASLHSGLPLTVSSNQNPNFFVNQRTNRGDKYRALKVHNGSVNQWFGNDVTADAPVQVTDAATGTVTTVNGCTDLTFNPAALGCAYGPESANGLGTSRVGTETNPAFEDLDMALSKGFTLVGERQLAFRADFFNILNHPSLAPPSNSISSSNFGQITNTVSTERQIQLALKLNF